MDSGYEVRLSKVTSTSVLRIETVFSAKAAIFSMNLNEDSSNYRFNILLRDEIFRRLPNLDILKTETDTLVSNRHSAILTVLQEALHKAHQLILQDLPTESEAAPRSECSHSQELPSAADPSEELSEEQVFGEGAYRLCTQDEASSKLFLATICKFSEDQLQRLAKCLIPWLSTLLPNKHSVPIVKFAVCRVPELRQACEDLCLKLIYKDALSPSTREILKRLLQSKRYSYQVLKLSISKLGHLKHSSKELIGVIKDATQNINEHISFQLINPLLFNILSKSNEVETIQLLNLVVDKACVTDLVAIGDMVAPNILILIDHPIGYQTVTKLIRSKHQGTLSTFEDICKESPVHLFVKKTRKIVFHAYLSLEDTQRQTSTLLSIFFAVRRTRSDLRYLLKKEISVCLLIALLCKLGMRIQSHLADLRLRVQSICQADPEISSNTFSSQLLSCLSKLLKQSRTLNDQVPAPYATEHQVQTYE